MIYTPPDFNLENQGLCKSNTGEIWGKLNAVKDLPLLHDAAIVLLV